MEEVIFASSSVDGGVGCWGVESGNPILRYKNCCSPPHGLVTVGRRFLASSQHRESSTTSSSGSVHYWSLHKPQVEIKSFPAKQIKPLVSDRRGTFLYGGSVSGDIYCWEVSSGRLLTKWHAHYRTVTCLALCDDQSLLVSGSEDGTVKVFSLVTVFDEVAIQKGERLHLHSFLEHTRPVTDIKVGYGGANAIIVSASEDRTCKVWRLSTGQLLRSIQFPTMIDAVALDPGEHVFHAGGRDGKIYIVALGAESPSDSIYGKHILAALSEQGKAVTCLTFCADGVSLVSGSEDGLIRVWDTRSRNIVRMIRHAKGPINNILVVTLPEELLKPQSCAGKKQSLLLPKPLEKYANATHENGYVVGAKVFIGGHLTDSLPHTASYVSQDIMNQQIYEMQQQGSFAAAKMELEREKADCNTAMQMVHRWKKTYENLHQFCVDEILDGDKLGKPTKGST
ncbi:uncharacterized protein [Phyllobates terribilis]|uniref:uncharacterized protein n=1 Tax=Phyllobates terribilis TaxID=111132 RepID=UPI003CCAE987